jgi:hypothetical protein
MRRRWEAVKPKENAFFGGCAKAETSHVIPRQTTTGSEAIYRGPNFAGVIRFELTRRPNRFILILKEFR